MEEFSELEFEHEVSVWEGIAITGGAVLIVAAGLIGLGVKALGNAFDADRAEAIAQSLMNYEIPGGSQGFFGTNIGGGKMAVVASTDLLPIPAEVAPIPIVELFLARMPLPAVTELETATGTEASPVADNGLFAGFSFSYPDPAAFQVETERIDQKLLCESLVPVTIQQGRLTLQPEVAPVPAIRYEVKRPSEAESNLVVISAVGEAAADRAEQVFNSLVCQGVG
ncbi:MAG: hypothetical protein MUF72_04110 [Elainella sp. Prado103]|jgi:hypothetical protein|nr:hypothetical protein [Elainella sp. Prado103]